MEEVSAALWQAAQAMSGLEVLATALGLAYLILAIRQNNWCWYAGFASTAIFSWLFWNVSLVMESALNIYYLLIAVYGWWAWKHGKAANNGEPLLSSDHQPLRIQRWGMKQHLLAASVIITLTFVSGYLLTENTRAALPYLDSFTTWGSVVTTWMVTRKVLDNWLYWQLFNSCAIVLYLDRELYLVAALMAVYLVLAVVGWFAWRRDYQQQLQYQH